MKEFFRIFVTWFCAGATLQCIQQQEYVLAIFVELIAILIFLSCRRYQSSNRRQFIITIEEIGQYLFIWFWSQKTMIHLQWGDYTLGRLVLNIILGAVIFSIL